MKLLMVLVWGLATQVAFAGMNCVGTTVVFNEDGTGSTTEVELKRMNDEKDLVHYFGQSKVFKFWADHDVSAKTISLEILDMRETVVLSNPRMQVAKFNVSIGGYWKTYFASLNCSPTQN